MNQYDFNNDFNSWYKKRKPLWETIFLFIVTFLVWFVTFSVTWQDSDNKKEISKLKEEISKNDQEIKWNDMYKRMDNYWYTLDLVKGLVTYKKYDIKWNAFLQDIVKIIPKEITVKNIQFSEQNNSIIMTVVSPIENKLIETMREIEKYSYVTGTDFTNVTKERVSFPWDKQQYEWYATVITTYIDKEFLSEKFLEPEEIDNIDSEESGKNENQWENFTDTNSWIILEEKEESFSPSYDF